MSMTCRTCPFWEQQAGQEEDANPRGYCHQARAFLGVPDDVNVRASGWCSEHPLRQRDHLAALAMQAIIAGSGDSGVFWSLPNSTARAGDVARSAYAFADAMLRARSRL